MKSLFLLFSFQLLFFFSLQVSFSEAFKIAFGSCNKVELNQDYWDLILKEKPGLWIWLGDVVYADNENIPFYPRSNSLSHMKEVYKKQLNNPKYQKY